MAMKACFPKRSASKPSTMLHTASGKSLDAIIEQFKEGQPIRVFEVFEMMPADAEQKTKQISRIVSLSTPREPAAAKMKLAA